jgi:hypothetical protein
MTAAEPPADPVRTPGPAGRVVSRRMVMAGLAGLGLGACVAGAVGVRRGDIPLPSPLSEHLADQGPAGVIPDVPPGRETVETVNSPARGGPVDLYTAVPDGHGDGHGLPVCLVLHGASATAIDYPRFGFGRFLTDHVRHGGAPFVLAGPTGTGGWSGPSQRMLREDLPKWCSDKGFDSSRLVAWGWSLGGYGSLLLAEAAPGFLRAVAAFSPAVSDGDDVFAGVAMLRGTRLGIWCGKSDGFYSSVRDLVDALPEPPEITAWAPGAHTRKYWNRITPDAFAFIGRALAQR